MAIKLKGNLMTFTGWDNAALKVLAKSQKMTAQQFVVKFLTILLKAIDMNPQKRGLK